MLKCIRIEMSQVKNTDERKQNGEVEYNIDEKTARAKYGERERYIYSMYKMGTKHKHTHT